MIVCVSERINLFYHDVLCVAGNGRDAEHKLNTLLEILRADPEEIELMAKDPVAEEVPSPAALHLRTQVPTYGNDMHCNDGRERYSGHVAKKRSRVIEDNDMDDYDMANDRPWPREHSQSTYDRGSKTSSRSSGGTPRARPINIPFK